MISMYRVKQLSVIIFLLLVILVTGIYFLTSRSVDGQTHLLIDDSRKVYTFSNLIPESEWSQYRDAGLASELTQIGDQSKIESVVAGLTFYDPRAKRSTSIELDIPTDEQRGQWQQSLAGLTLAQSDLCSSIQKSDMSQYCLVRHLTYQAILNNSGSQVCSTLIEDSFVEECESDIAENNLSKFIDQDENGLLDLFESFAN